MWKFRRKEKVEESEEDILDRLELVLNPPKKKRSKILSAFGWSLPVISVALFLSVVISTLALGTYPAMIPTMGKSMNPLLYNGDLAFIKGVDTDTLEIGDDIAVRITEDAQLRYNVPSIVLHRIISIDEGGQGLVFETQGINNPEPDLYRTAEPNVIGKMVFHLPKAGYPLLIAAGPLGWYIFGGSAGLILIYLMLGVYDRNVIKNKARDELMLRLARNLQTDRHGIHNDAEGADSNEKAG